MLRTACDLRVNCEFGNIFSLFFHKTIWHSSENSLLSGAVCRFESAEGLGCKSCLWITVISCKVLRVGAAGVRAASYCGPSWARHRSSVQKAIVTQRLPGRVEEREGLAGNQPGALGNWQGMKAGGNPSGGGVLRMSLQTGLCRPLDVKAFQAHKPFLPSSTARGCCGADFEGYICVGCIPCSQRRKGWRPLGYRWVVAISTWRRVAAWEQRAFVLFCFFFSSGGSFINSLWLFLSSWQRCE